MQQFCSALGPGESANLLRFETVRGVGAPQRGSNENTNGLLRQYYPKGTDLSLVSQAQLDLVARKLNARPRQTLNWKTPAYILQSSVSSTA
jgi:IS30 family transposase